MGCLFMGEEIAPRRNGTGGKMEVSVVDNHGSIELRVGPPDEGDGDESYVVTLTARQALSIAETLHSVVHRLGGDSARA